MQTDDKGTKKTRRSRYWSVMLVGEHGRVIPFRHFKGLAMGVCIALILSLGALIVLGVMYTHQRQKLIDMRNNLAQERAQAAKFRDEKDLFLTQLIALRKQTGEPPQNTSEKSEPAEESKSVEAKAPEKKALGAEQPKEPVQKAQPQVKWAADIRNFDVTYDNQLQILKAQFRIYNISQPKQRLSGRTVVVFKVADDPPIQWSAVPAVPLSDGKPTGNAGKAFRVNNYRTETFKTLRRKNSAKFNIASIYVFTDEGELIANQEMPFNVDYSPPEPPKPVEPPQKSVQEKSVVVPGDQQGGQTNESVSQPNQPEATPTRDDSTQSPANSPEPPPAGSVVQGVLKDDKQQEPQSNSENRVNFDPANAESTGQTPTKELQPAVEGESK